MKRGSLCKKKGMGMDMAVSIKQLIDKLELQNLTPEVDIMMRQDHRSLVL